MQGDNRLGSPFGSKNGARTPAGGHCYVVRGFGENEPAHVQLLSSSDLDAAIGICDDEIRLIDKAIKADHIPVPDSLFRERPTFTLNIDRQELADEARALDGLPDYETRRRYAKRVPLLDRLMSLKNRHKFAPLAEAVLEVARGNNVLVIGDDGRAAASLLCVRGMEAVHLYPARQVEQQNRRSHRRSVGQWLCDSGHDVDDIGALVLVGEGNFEPDLDTLADVGGVPPVIRVKLQNDGAPLVTSATPAKDCTLEDSDWPKISVVTVSFNQADYLEASIRSVLDQDYPNLEYIIVDGGSTDGSVEIIERYRDRFAKVIIEPDRGQSDALNKGFALATGDMMNWLCSDDLLESGSLANIGRVYRRYGADLVAGGCARIGEAREVEHYSHHTVLPLDTTVKLMPLDILHFMRSWQAGNYFFQPEVFFSRRIWLASGAYFKEHMFYAMDYDLWLRMALAGATARHIPVPIGCSRIHAQQKTQDDRKYLHQLRQLMEEYQNLFRELQAAGPASSTVNQT